MRLIASIIFTLLMTVQNSLFISFHTEENFEDYSIKKFLNTTEPIWTYNTTAVRRRFCEVYVMHNITEELILFNRSYFKRKQNITATKQEKGIFSDRFEDEMSVVRAGGRAIALEQLFYVNANYTCGVFMVIPEYNSTLPYYDLRVKNSSVVYGPDANCTTEFDGIGPPGRLAYESKCQTIMFPKPSVS